MKEITNQNAAFQRVTPQFLNVDTYFNNFAPRSNGFKYNIFLRQIACLFTKQIPDCTFYFFFVVILFSFQCLFHCTTKFESVGAKSSEFALISAAYIFSASFSSVSRVGSCSVPISIHCCSVCIYTCKLGLLIVSRSF